MLGQRRRLWLNITLMRGRSSDRTPARNFNQCWFNVGSPYVTPVQFRISTVPQRQVEKNQKSEKNRISQKSTPYSFFWKHVQQQKKQYKKHKRN